jgi:hypothetical protein
LELVEGFLSFGGMGPDEMKLGWDLDVDFEGGKSEILGTFT